MKPHIKVIQRNGVDIFVTSSLVMKDSNSDRSGNDRLRRLAQASRSSVGNQFQGLYMTRATNILGFSNE
jgi:hypothetical protein